MTIFGLPPYIAIGLIAAGTTLSIGVDATRRAMRSDPYSGAVDAVFGAVFTIALALLAIIAWPGYIAIGIVYHIITRHQEETR